MEHAWCIDVDQVSRDKLLLEANITRRQAELGSGNLLGGLSTGQYRLRNVSLTLEFCYTHPADHTTEITDDYSADVAWTLRGLYVALVIKGPLPDTRHSIVAREGPKRLEKMLKDETLKGLDYCEADGGSRDDDRVRGRDSNKWTVGDLRSINAENPWPWVWNELARR